MAQPDPSTPVTAADLTLDEKAALTSGADFWTTKGVERLGVPSVMMTWAWCRSRSTAAVAKVLGMMVS